ncbi:hypothetical protein QYE76_046329 [Lolium multiflorum]|uniref:Disease resistance N-terminal domain-containing protein n=1 Tax=Lolium multiflorum TaxID=4521 RepID=A0AAD8TPS1_LOLMU|nr:hypothetical protein QYE76_046329 [Lolium multiflorum]
MKVLCSWDEMAGFLGTVVDAAIGWLVQSILGSFFTGQMEAWIREIGLAEDVEKLKFQMRYVEMVLAAAKGRRINNKPLAQSLDDLKELLYDSEDVRNVGSFDIGQLQSMNELVSLGVSQLENVKTKEEARAARLTDKEMSNLMEISVPSLEELILTDMPKLEKCIGSYGMDLTSHLRVLMINNCPQLNEFTLFQSYSSFDAEQKSWFPSLNRLSIQRCPHIM